MTSLCRAVVLVFVAFAASQLLFSCGGGEQDEERRTTEPITRNRALSASQPAP